LSRKGDFPALEIRIKRPGGNTSFWKKNPQVSIKKDQARGRILFGKDQGFTHCRLNSDIKGVNRTTRGHSMWQESFSFRFVHRTMTLYVNVSGGFLIGTPIPGKRIARLRRRTIVQGCKGFRSSWRRSEPVKGRFTTQKGGTTPRPGEGKNV